MCSTANRTGEPKDWPYVKPIAISAAIKILYVRKRQILTDVSTALAFSIER
jgi:hypothetical protein